jgi:Ca2+-binding EF-hand superfamily protein
MNMLSSFRLSLDELKRIQHEFNLLDKNKDGTISLNELLLLKNSNMPQFKDMDWN